MSLARTYARLYERRARRAPRRRLAWALAIAGALLLHLAFVGVAILAASLHLTQHGEKRPSRPVTLRPVTAQQWALNRGGPAREHRDSAVESKNVQPPRPEPKKKEEPHPKGQVVDVAPGNNEEAPDAKYLAESANKVRKESRSKDQTPDYRNAMPHRTSTAPNTRAGSDQVESPAVAGNNGLANDDRPLANAGKSAQAFEVPDTRQRDEIALRDTHSPGPGQAVSNRTESDPLKGNSNRLRIQKGEEGAGARAGSQGRQGAPGVANLLPSISVLDKLSGAAPNDHLSDVDEGEGTFLNTKEWKYASFFNRVKQSVGMHWDPGTTLRQRDPSGNIYGGRDRYTVLNITLSDRGVVKDIYVEKSCGIDFLDLEAIKSFERGQPFPNPPPGLVGSDQTVRFSFGFFLEMGSGAGLRIFRQGG